MTLPTRTPARARGRGRRPAQALPRRAQIAGAWLLSPREGRPEPPNRPLIACARTCKLWREFIARRGCLVSLYGCRPHVGGAGCRPEITALLSKDSTSRVARTPPRLLLSPPLVHAVPLRRQRDVRREHRGKRAQRAVQTVRARHRICARVDEHRSGGEGRGRSWVVLRASGACARITAVAHGWIDGLLCGRRRDPSRSSRHSKSRLKVRLGSLRSRMLRRWAPLLVMRAFAGGGVNLHVGAAVWTEKRFVVRVMAGYGAMSNPGRRTVNWPAIAGGAG
jgi:hypothetical protein